MPSSDDSSSKDSEKIHEGLRALREATKLSRTKLNLARSRLVLERLAKLPRPSIKRDKD